MLRKSGCLPHPEVAERVMAILLGGHWFEPWGCLTDSGFLRLLSCAAHQSAHFDGLCGFHAAGALEGALHAAAPKTGRELFDSL